MLHAMDEDGRSLVDPIVPASGRPQSREIAHERLACPFRRHFEATEQQLDGGGPDLLGKAVQMTEAFRRDLDLVHEESAGYS